MRLNITKLPSSLAGEGFHQVFGDDDGVSLGNTGMLLHSGDPVEAPFQAVSQS